MEGEFVSSSLGAAVPAESRIERKKQRKKDRKNEWWMHLIKSKKEKEKKEKKEQEEKEKKEKKEEQTIWNVSGCIRSRSVSGAPKYTT